MPRRVYRKKSPTEELFTLHTLSEIAKYLRVENRTVKRYIKDLGLPVAIDLCGNYFTTRGAIDDWVTKLAADQRRERYGGNGGEKSSETIQGNTGTIGNATGES